MKSQVIDNDFIRPGNKKINKKQSVGAGAQNTRKRFVSKKGSPHLELFQKEDCPFSHAVRRTLSELSLDFVAHNVTDANPVARAALIESGGKDQIPFLFDHRTGVKLYDTNAIQAYLENEYGQDESRGIGRIVKSISSRFENQRERIGWTVKTSRERAQDIRETIRGTIRFVSSFFSPKGGEPRNGEIKEQAQESRTAQKRKAA